MSPIRCNHCVLSAAFPGIKFDENGVCNFCRDEILSTTGKEAVAKARSEVAALIDKAAGQNAYDAVMCYSGGKDSTYTLKLAIEKYGLSVLAFTFDNGYLSSTALENIKKITDALNIDHLTFKPAKRIFDDIILASAFKRIYAPASLRRISSGCYACISIVNNMALQLALEKRAPFIVAGFTLGQIPANAIIYQNNYEFLRDSRKQIVDRLQKHVGPKVQDYFTIADSTIKKHSSYPHTINLLCLEQIQEDEIKDRIRPLGWREPDDVDGCSSNCRLNVFNNYVHQLKFGYSPYELELSHMIRSGLLDRDQALQKLSDQSEEQCAHIMDALGVAKTQLEDLRP
jgi:NH3-dependent NAD+ synthetase